MNCEKILPLLPELHDELLPDELARTLRKHLETCPACSQEWAEISLILDTIETAPSEEPSAALRAGFQRRLRDEKKALRLAAQSSAPRPGLLARLFVWQNLLFSGAGVALLALGFFLGARLTQTQPAKPVSENELQLARMQTRLDTLEQLLSQTINPRDSDTTRLLQTSAFSSGGGTSLSNSPRLARLLGTLAFDPSTNVRLSALESLYAHASDPLVRQGIMASLPREHSPLVQLAMIDFLAALNTREVAPALETLARDPSLDPNVKNAALKVLATLPAEAAAQTPGKQL